ncbi:MAG TPA: MoaD/ThiS family protein [Vicinamibacterales bacterium]|jgi:molybdopterin converting factor small subunit
MALVHLPSGWRTATGGVVDLTIDARRVGDLLRELTARYPALDAELHTVAVAIDGEIFNDPEFMDINAATEIHIVPRVAGG